MKFAKRCANRAATIRRSILLASLTATFLLVAITVQGQTFQVLHTFAGLGGGVEPQAGLTMDRAGNFYGTTYAGGLGNGTVFKLTHVGSGWILTTLYEFQGVQDGATPQARVVFGPNGTLYGTTTNGGSGNYGTVFNLRPPATFCRTVQCPWTETVLYNFTDHADGGNPQSDLTFDSAGNIYGTTFSGGRHTCPCGVVFKLSPSGQGWTESVVYTFTDGADGAAPLSGVTFDSAGNLYGTATEGGSNLGGTVYELTPSESGRTETTLHSFGAHGDGNYPAGGVVLDSRGNIYGTTYEGGSDDGGTVYQLQPDGGNWNYSTLYNFPGAGGPLDTLTMDAAGHLYGTTFFVGADQSGSVFKLTPTAGGWTFADLYDFTGGNDGANPAGSVVIDGQGNLYSTTLGGGAQGDGVVWELTP